MMKKRGISCLLVIALLVTFAALPLLGGCTQQGKDQPVAKGGDEAAAPAAPSKQEVIELNMNFTTPENINEPFKNFAKAVEEKSGGRVKFNIYYSNSLVPVNEIPKAVSTGVADMSACPPYVFPSVFPLSGEITGLPFLGMPSMEAAYDIYMELFEKHPEMRAEFEKLGIKVLTGYMMPPQQIMNATDKKIVLPSDVKGRKIISPKAAFGKIITAAGAAPVSQNVSDYYMSLERGVAEGVCTHIPATFAFGLAPLLKQVVIFGEGGLNMDMHFFVINQGVWDRLPDDIKAIFEEELENLHNAEADQLIVMLKDYAEKLTAQGTELTYLTPEQIAEWEKIAKPVHEEIISEMESQGMPAARAIYEDALKLIEEYKKTH
jgi:TRAP-type C4-dicarboxylate transport system substrate-binding protein